MKEAQIELQRAIEGLHDCRAKHRKSVKVVEEFRGQIVWDGVVHVFEIMGHAQSNICYAWSSPIEGSDKRKFYAVLHVPPVDSPQAAVRAAIVSDYKEGG